MQKDQQDPLSEGSAITLGFLPPVEDRAHHGQGWARRGDPIQHPLLATTASSPSPRFASVRSQNRRDYFGESTRPANARTVVEHSERLAHFTSLIIVVNRLICELRTKSTAYVGNISLYL